MLKPGDSKAQEAFVHDDEPDDCQAAQEVEGCFITAEGEMVCESYTYCGDEGSYGSSESIGGNQVLGGTWCVHVLGTENSDNIYIGSIWMYSYWGFWYTFGDLGYCKNGQFVHCSAAANPITVKPYQSNNSPYYDRVRVPTNSILYSCGDYAIGQWESLKSGYQSISLKVYGCAGRDYIYTTPNDDIIIAGSGNDIVYGRGGNDDICGDYMSISGHDCEFCYSGANCTPSGGYDTGGNSWSDLLYGHEGSDLICGVGGNDLIYGGSGNDTIYGMNGCDELYGDSGADTIYAATGSTGSYLNDYCSSSDRNMLMGCDGDDTLHGANSKDWLWGEVNFSYTALEYDGSDFLYGYGGDDGLCPGGTLSSQTEQAEGGSGNDTIYYYLGDYMADFCTIPHNPYLCLGAGKYAKGNDGDDNLHFAPIYCDYPGATWDRDPCKPVCGGGAALYGNGHDSGDCCDCGGSIFCDSIGCEQTSGCSHLSGFYCPFPYHFDDYCTDYTY